MKFHLTGDILHAGVVEVEADDIEAAIDKATEERDFVVIDEQGKDLGFVFANHATDAEGNDLDDTFLTSVEGRDPSAEVIRIVFTVADIEQEIREQDENRGADNKPPLDHAKAFDDVLEWAKSIQERGTEHVFESLGDIINTGSI